MSMRRFISTLHNAGEFVETEKQLEPKHEVAAWTRRVCDHEDRAFATVLDDPNLYMDTVVGGIYGTKDRIKRILDPNYENSFAGDSDIKAVKHYVKSTNVTNVDLLDDRYSRVIPNTEAKCQENISMDPNLFKLPICIHNTKDLGAFITAGVNVVKWLDGKTHGLGIHRMYRIDHNHLSCLAPPNRRIGLPHFEASKKGEGIKMAVCIGAPPEVVLASQAKIDHDAEKYIVATNLRGRAIELVKCVTSDILVPASTEIVIECTSIPNSTYNDTPFGEYPGTYSTRSNAWTCKVDCITYRNSALYQTVLTGKVPQEDSYLCAIPYAAEVYQQARHLVDEITDISVFLGNNVFDTIICIKKRSNSQVENLMHLLLGNKYLKSVCVMDHDLTADEKSWRFAFNTRYQPNRDTIITNLGLGASLDPSSPLFQSTSKIAMDLTVPISSTDEETKKNWERHSIANVVKELIPSKIA